MSENRDPAHWPSGEPIFWEYGLDPQMGGDRVNDKQHDALTNTDPAPAPSRRFRAVCETCGPCDEVLTSYPLRCPKCRHPVIEEQIESITSAAIKESLTEILD